MPGFNPRKFTNPDWLGTISPQSLAALLSPWREYLASRGVNLHFDSADHMDCSALATVLMTPDSSVPIEMIDALYYVHETCTAEDVEELQATTRRRGLSIVAAVDTAAVDYVIHVWLADADLIRDRQAEVVARRQQAFEFFASKHRRGSLFPAVENEARTEIEAALDDWFAEHKRGRGCRLVILRERRYVWVLVRHGRSMRRELSHADDGSTATQFYRPQKHDVLIYDQESGEIAVHASTKGERELYLRTLGRKLFGDEGYFPQTKKFDLAPLMEHGSACLQCDDIDGIESIRLIEYRQYWGGPHKESEVRRAADVFAALAARGFPRPRGPTPSSATFVVKFDDSPMERRVVIRVPSSARFERNEDSELVERWLALRGFVTRSSGIAEQDNAVATEVLGHARIDTGVGHRLP